MLAWCSDIIVASDDAKFICTSTKMGGSGVEFWAYPWEINPRRAKQWMLTGEMSAQRAEQWGYHRFWLAEHHNIPSVACAATAVVIRSGLAVMGVTPVEEMR